jgi:hypothetical protein
MFVGDVVPRSFTSKLGQYNSLLGKDQKLGITAPTIITRPEQSKLGLHVSKLGYNLILGKPNPVIVQTKSFTAKLGHRLSKLRVSQKLGDGIVFAPNSSGNVLFLSQNTLLNKIRPKIDKLGNPRSRLGLIKLANGVYEALPRFTAKLGRHISRLGRIKFAGTAVEYIKSLSQALSLNQTVSKYVVHNKSVNQTLTFSETINDFDIHLPINNQTLILNQLTNNYVIHNRTINELLTFNETITNYVIHNRTINQPLTLNETVDYIRIRILNESASDSLTFTEQVTFVRKMAITDKLGKPISKLGSIKLGIGVNESIKSSNIIETLTFSQSATYTLIHVWLAQATNTLTFSISVEANQVFNRSINESLNITEAVISPSAVQHVTQTLTFNETPVGNRVLTQSTDNTLIFSEFAHTAKVYNKTVNQTLTFNQSATSNSVYHRSANNVLTFTQSPNAYTGDLIEVSANNTLTFNQSVTVNVTHSRSISEILTFNQNFNRIMVYDRHLYDELIFNPYYVKKLPIQRSVSEIVIPLAMVIVVHHDEPSAVILQTDDSVILLPSPQFDDTLNNSGSLVLKRSMNGLTYSYIKSTDLQKIHYTFRLGLPKSKELRNFIINNSSKLIKMTNWKGEIWMVKVVINPVKLDPKMRWENCDSERIDTTLDFEGVKILG